MERNLAVIIFTTNDLDAGKRLFTSLLGTEPYADAPYYVGYRPGPVEIGLVPNPSGGKIEGPVAYWDTPELKAAVDSLVAAGATVRKPISEVAPGMHIAVLSDADGNPIGLRGAA
jgi:predicted enzyme related to lactoylglutathione lyase